MQLISFFIVLLIIQREDPQFEVGDHVRESKYENIFAKDYVPN